jgi:hypothetical protein
VDVVLKILEERNGRAHPVCRLPFHPSLTGPIHSDEDILEKCLGVLRFPGIDFSCKAVATPLLQRLNRSNYNARRIIAHLLTMLSAQYSSLIDPFIRAHIRSTIVLLESREGQP